MSTTAFFQQNSLPVFEYLSADSKRALETYIQSGNRAFREKKLLEFFKAIDWLPLEDLVPDNPLKKLDSLTERQINREIHRYFEKKAETRAEAAEQRKDYRLRIFAYYREKISSADKVLLESLRDYELDLTGRDVNWRHHFTLDSFKKIDDFVASSQEARMQRILLFKKDVETYKKNYEKLHHQARCDHSFSFDDWCDMMGEARFKSGHSRQRQAKSQAVNNVLYQAFKTLELPWTATPEEVKRQFRKLTLKHHPDLPDGCEETMKKILSAYEEVQRSWKLAGQYTDVAG